MKLRALLIAALATLLASASFATQINTSARCSPYGDCSIGDTNTDSITLTTDGATLSVDVTANAAILTATTTNSATFTGADAAGAANTIYDTTGAGTVTLGSADVTAVILKGDADVQIQNGATGNVDLSFHDYADTADDDMAHALLRTNCTTATTGAEDCDFSIGVVEAGNAADTRLLIDADGGLDLGSASTNDFTVTTDGAGLDVDSTTANTLTLKAATTGTASFVGADAASPANTALDTTGAGTITIGSADVLGTSVVTDGGTVSIDGTITSSATSDLGWSIQTGANTACNTTCTSACVMGFELDAWDATSLLACSDATADACLCAGSS